MSTQLVNSLYWKEMKEQFKAGSVKVKATGQIVEFDELKDAIEDGTLASMVTDCANLLHNGDVKAVITAMRKNLASVKYNMNKKNTVNKPDEIKRYDMLIEFLDSIDVAVVEAKPGKPAATAGKNIWEYTKEDIDLIDTSNSKQLYSVYNCMHSKLTRYPDVIAERFGMQNYLDTIDYVSDLYSKSKKEASKVTVSDALMEKLASGKRNLTKAEMAEVLAALAKLNK